MTVIITKLVHRKKGKQELYRSYRLSPTGPRVALQTLPSGQQLPIYAEDQDADIMLQRTLAGIADYWHFEALGKPAVQFDK